MQCHPNFDGNRARNIDMKWCHPNFCRKCVNLSVVSIDGKERSWLIVLTTDRCMYIYQPCFFKSPKFERFHGVIGHLCNIWHAKCKLPYSPYNFLKWLHSTAYTIDVDILNTLFERQSSLVRSTPWHFTVSPLLQMLFEWVLLFNASLSDIKTYSQDLFSKAGHTGRNSTIGQQKSF